MTRCRSVLAVLSCVLTIGYTAPPARLHVVTFMNQPDRHLAYSAVTAQAHGLYPVLIGYGIDAWWPDGLGTKINALRSYVFSQLGDNDILLFIDAFDVLVFGDEAEIVDRFNNLERQSNRSLVFNAEEYCFPKNQSGGEGVCDNYPPAPHRWRHLNSGIIAGRGHAVKRMLKDPVPNVIRGSDQKWYQQYFRSNPGDIQLDYECYLMCGVTGDSESEGVRITDQRILIPETDNTPPLVHCVGVGHWTNWRQGKATHALHEIFKRFYPDQAARLLDSWTIEAVLGTTHTMQLYKGEGYWTPMRKVLCLQCGWLGSQHTECKFFPNRFDAECWLVSVLFMFSVLGILSAASWCLIGLFNPHWSFGAPAAAARRCVAPADGLSRDSLPGSPSKNWGHGATNSSRCARLLECLLRCGRPTPKAPEFDL
eukprot:TRINITY_DN112274_c0_g1_i1.p1 TRINITY_DN112274_c0_g1~~TRINITY_DN112274_c0_g1_i1.p1  ORF type:complete len:424 (+),score=12.93 TRINITY_DN112274_c0_g1_i1:140-1411(+)